VWTEGEQKCFTIETCGHGDDRNITISCGVI